MQKKTSISRVTRTKAEAKDTYNALSKWYDLIAGLAEKKYKFLGLQTLKLQPGESVLEIGFGTGQCLLPIARAVGKTGQVHGIDLSEGMLQVAQSKLDRAGLAEQAKLQCADALHLPYPDAMFDALFISFTLELFDTPEIPMLLAECRRVLKSGGRLAVVAMAQQANPGWMLKLYEWSHRAFPKAVDCRPIYASRDVETARFRIDSVDQQRMFGLPVEIILAVKTD